MGECRQLFPERVASTDGLEGRGEGGPWRGHSVDKGSFHMGHGAISFRGVRAEGQWIPHSGLGYVGTLCLGPWKPGSRECPRLEKVSAKEDPRRSRGKGGRLAKSVWHRSQEAGI